MSRHRVARTVLATSIVLSVGLLLSGCVGTVGNIVVHAAVNAKAALAQKGKPHKGECWQASFKYADGYADWGSKPPVSCESAHTLYTFAVVPLHSVHKGALFDKTGHASGAIEDDAYETCINEEDINLPQIDATIARIYLEDYLPNETQWGAGARWVRCDVAILRIGSSVSEPEFASMESFSRLTHDLATHPGRYGFCVNVPIGSTAIGPKQADAVYASCDENASWRLHSYEDLDAAPGDQYPSAADLHNQYVQSCESKYGDATHVTFAAFPSRSDWNNGDEQFECWVGNR